MRKCCGRLLILRFQGALLLSLPKIPLPTPLLIQSFLIASLTDKRCFTPSVVPNVSLPLNRSAIISQATLPLSLPMRRSLPTWRNREQPLSTPFALLVWTRILVRVLSMVSSWFTTLVVSASLMLPSGYVISHIKFHDLWSYCLISIASHSRWSPPNPHLHHCRESCRCYQGVLGLNDSTIVCFTGLYWD